jgi:hypothetical protein
MVKLLINNNWNVILGYIGYTGSVELIAAFVISKCVAIIMWETVCGSRASC